MESPDKDNVEKKHRAENFAAYKRRMSRLCAVQAIYMHEYNTKAEKLDPSLISHVTANITDEAKADNLCLSVLYFYKNVVFLSGEYGANRRSRKIDEVYTRQIARFVLKNEQIINGIISKYLNEKWTVEKLNPVVRAILKCAVAEIMYNKKTDIRILSSEYTNLASQFFTGKEIGFVNGVVDRISKDIRHQNNGQQDSSNVPNS